ncbi:MAG: hypothetical protein F6K41_23575 [Symploca sp. SIO3E6]|nr:hypothetical protein [Caldora sp. SIO3E6]
MTKSSELVLLGGVHANLSRDKGYITAKVVSCTAYDRENNINFCQAVKINCQQRKNANTWSSAILLQNLNVNLY